MKESLWFSQYNIVLWLTLVSQSHGQISFTGELKLRCL